LSSWATVSFSRRTALFGVGQSVSQPFSQCHNKPHTAAICRPQCRPSVYIHCMPTALSISVPAQCYVVLPSSRSLACASHAHTHTHSKV